MAVAVDGQAVRGDEARGGDVRSGIRVRDVAFFVFLAAYALGGLAVLAQGVGAVAASFSDTFHESLHIRGLGTGFTARVSQRMADASHGIGGPGSIALDYAFSLFNLLLAVFLLWLRPRDRTARLLAVGLVGAAGVFNLTAQATLEQLPMTPVESFVQAAAHIVAGLGYVYALLLFPDGRPVPRWPAWAVTLLYLPATAGAVFLALLAAGTARPAALLVFFGLLTPAVGVAAQGYRFRRSATAAAYQQARLLFWALLPALIVGLVSVAVLDPPTTTTTSYAGRHVPQLPVVVFRVFQPVFALIPVALFAGILRYRLWDIDRVINRTLVYGAVTATLVGAYLGIVVLLQRVFAPVTRESDLAVAVSTLAVAAGFRPLLRRVQAFVDRRFYRQRYDAVTTIEHFAARLREQIDLDSLTGELRTVVMDAMQPAHVSMWLRQPDGCIAWAWTHRKPGRAPAAVPAEAGSTDHDHARADAPVTVP